MLEEDKENDDSIMIVSPVLETVKKARQKNSKPHQRSKSPQTPKKPISKFNQSPLINNLTNPCQCAASRIIYFQLEMFKMLSEYSKCRTKMSSQMSNLMQSRIKIKDTAADIKTNADNLSLQTISSSSLICTEFCDENGIKMDDSIIMKKLDHCLKILENLSESKEFKENLYREEKTLKKQFFESIDLLGQMYGFFGILLNRIKVFNMKLDILNSEIEKANSYDQVGPIYTSNVFNLMRAYLNANMCDEFLQLNNIFLNANLADDNSINKNVESKAKKEPKGSKTKGYSLKDIKSLVERNRLISSKPESLIHYYLLLSHYYILKHKVKRVHSKE